MNGWILDTNIVSQFAPMADGKQRTHETFNHWVRRHQEHLYLSAISIVEITAGIEKLRRAGSTRRVVALNNWFGSIIALYGERIISVDAKVGSIAGLLTDQARANGSHPGFADILIAATASAYQYGLLTQNIRHFVPLNLDIMLIDPLTQALPI